MHFTAIAATTEPDRNGNSFSIEALHQLAEGIGRTPILDNFDPFTSVGVVTRGRVINDTLQVAGQINLDYITKMPIYVVPGCRSIKHQVVDGVMIMEQVKLTCFGLVLDPADTKVSPIKICED